jgi:hypothetical protein
MFLLPFRCFRFIIAAQKKKFKWREELRVRCGEWGVRILADQEFAVSKNTFYHEGTLSGSTTRCISWRVV